MSKTIMTDTIGWSPLIDSVTRECGIITAMVFGVIWRFCQMGNGVCNATQSSLAEILNLNRKTVNHHINILIKNGYIIDTTPDLIGYPHKYEDTGKATQRIHISATVCVPTTQAGYSDLHLSNG